MSPIHDEMNECIRQLLARRDYIRAWAKNDRDESSLKDTFSFMTILIDDVLSLCEQDGLTEERIRVMLCSVVQSHMGEDRE